MVQAAVSKLLLSTAAITAIVGTRIRPVIADQDDVRPYLTLSISNRQATLTHSGAAGSGNATVEIGIIGDTYDQVDTLAGLIDTALHGYRGQPSGAECRIAPAQYDDESDIEQATPPGAATPAYLKTVSYKCRYVKVAS